MIALLCLAGITVMVSLAVATTMRSLLRDALKLIDTQSRRIVMLEASRDCLVAALDAAFSAPTSDATCAKEMTR